MKRNMQRAWKGGSAISRPVRHTHTRQGFPIGPGQPKDSTLAVRTQGQGTTLGRGRLRSFLRENVQV